MSIKSSDMMKDKFYRVTYKHSHYDGEHSYNVYTVRCDRGIDGHVKILTKNGSFDNGGGYCVGADSIEEISEWEARHPGKPLNNKQASLKFLKKN